MPTNRPFFANFLAAFRAHSAISKATATTTTTTTTTSTPTSAFSPQSLTSRTLATTSSATTKSPSPGATTAAVQAANHLSHTRHPSAGSVSRSPPHPQSSFGRPQRRGSDSSGEGYRDVLGGEKWYVGGLTANGEERFYRLGMVRKERSGDRLSLDRLSL
ncbi:hypothetical protein N7G274_006930 [Stereocaulon virgatum]|uniref:Uncharacterized protein n=1 Tax=Stereocaulon virgatum TaxID=373712 RepID=A0ABR4A7X0_9LECA